MKNVEKKEKNHKICRKIMKNVEKLEQNYQKYKKSSDMLKNWKKTDKNISNL